MHVCKLVGIGCHTQLLSFYFLRKSFNEPRVPWLPIAEPKILLGFLPSVLRLKVRTTTLPFYSDFRNLSFTPLFALCVSAPTLATSAPSPFPVDRGLTISTSFILSFALGVQTMVAVFIDLPHWKWVNNSYCEGSGGMCILALIKLDGIGATVCLLKSS